MNCDKLAASPFDPQRKSPGISYDQLDADAAINACAEAFKLMPDVPRIQFQYARTLQKSGQYLKAVKLYRELADQGHTLAQNNLGAMYYNGMGVSQSDVEAVKWYRKAAEQGYARAQDDLGSMYYAGRGVPQSDAEAVKWYRKAAEQAYANAQNNLGFMYHYGRGVAQSNEKAVNWFHLAAEKGNANAQNNLGILHQNGQGVTQSNTEAIKWYRKAAEQGNVIAQQNLAYFSEAENRMPKSDIDDVNRYRKAAEQGDAEAAYNLGMSYLNGRGVLKDVYKGRSWLGKSAMGGYYQASRMLANLNQQQRELDQKQRNDYNKISPVTVFLGVIIGGAVLAAMSNGSDTSNGYSSGSDRYDPLEQWNKDRMDDWNQQLLFGP